MHKLPLQNTSKHSFYGDHAEPSGVENMIDKE